MISQTLQGLGLRIAFGASVEDTKAMTKLVQEGWEIMHIGNAEPEELLVNPDKKQVIVLYRTFK